MLLFLGGIYLGLGVSGKVPSAIGHSGPILVLPFVLTVAGGALAVYAYEAWYENTEGPGGKRRRSEGLKDMPSFEIFHPPRERGP
ncbi:MAG TPA: hypothetical protein VGV89_01980 [Thermoplasmata archaeon]|nr:hypothetical protein [Thermoplasmata archaeon]